MRERHAAHPVRQQPAIVVAGNADDVRGGEQAAAGIDVAGSIHDIARTTERVDALADQMLERSFQSPVFGVNVTNQSQTSNARVHESSRSSVERVYASQLMRGDKVGAFRARNDHSACS